VATKLIRLLTDKDIDGIKYRCNDLVEIDEDVAKALEDDGAADGHEIAIEYVMAVERREVLKHPEGENKPKSKKK